MIKLETNYGKDKFHISKDIFDLWFEMFAGCEEQGLKLAIEKYIRESEYPPNIAERADLVETIKAQYSIIRSIWGESYDAETLKTIQDYIVKFPKKTRKVEMVELTHDAVSFRHDCDACGRVDIPTIKEYIQGKR